MEQRRGYAAHPARKQDGGSQRVLRLRKPRINGHGFIEPLLAAKFALGLQARPLGVVRAAGASSRKRYLERRSLGRLVLGSLDRKGVGQRDPPSQVGAYAPGMISTLAAGLKPRTCRSAQLS